MSSALEAPDPKRKAPVAPAPVSGHIDEAERERRLASMKRNATLMLVGCAVVFGVALWLEGTWPWLGYVRATAEAAIVGGLADWFAVTALFGVDALLGVLSLPFLLSIRSLEQSGAATTVPLVLYYAVYVWSIDVTAFIFGRAIERPYFLGLAFSVGFWLLLQALRASMFPAVTG